MRSRESNGELANVEMGPVDSLEAYQVVSEELHNEGRVLVALLAQSVEFCDDKLDTMISTGRKRKQHTSNGIVKGKLGQMASLVRGVEDLVVEDREVKSEPETDGVGGGKLGLSDFGGTLVSFEGSVGSTLAAVANGEFCEITVVVTHPTIELAPGFLVFLRIRISKRTSCGRTHEIHRCQQRESGASGEPRGCHRRSWPIRPRSSDGTP